MLISSKKGLFIKDLKKDLIPHYDREEQQRIKRFLKIIFEADKRCFEKLLEERKLKKQTIDNQIKASDKKVLRDCS